MHTHTVLLQPLNNAKYYGELQARTLINNKKIQPIRMNAKKHTTHAQHTRNSNSKKKRANGEFDRWRNVQANIKDKETGINCLHTETAKLQQQATSAAPTEKAILK